MLALLGLDRAIAAGDGPAQFEASVTGAWGAPLRLKATLSGSGLDAEAQGTAEPWAQDTTANVNLKVRRASLAPLFDLKPPTRWRRTSPVIARLAEGNKLTFEDLDSTIAGSRLRGRLALTLGEEKKVEGEVGLDALDLAPAFGLRIGAAGRDATEPLGPGLLKAGAAMSRFRRCAARFPAAPSCGRSAASSRATASR